MYSSKIIPNPSVELFAEKETCTTKKTKKEIDTKELVKNEVEENNKKENSSSIEIGNYKIRICPGSAYAIIYRIMSKLGRFHEFERLLENLDTSNKQSCEMVLKNIMVERDYLEKILRADDEFKKYCENQTIYYKERASNGDKKAMAVMLNQKRWKNGLFYGNFREVLSVLTGSSSGSAKNRNTKKYNDASICFKIFPTSLRGRKGVEHPVFLIMTPTKYLEKISSMLRTLFGDERSKNFISYFCVEARKYIGR